MSDSPMHMLWVEKYRPQSIDDMALDEGHRTLLKSFQAAGEIPHLLMTGPPGIGKTTIARILIKGIPCDVLALNASKDRGIDVIRDRVGTFAKILKPKGIWKFVFFDEADGLTPDAQNSLRNLMEEFHDQTRFILTANHAHKIIAPVQSRCTALEFGVTPLKERILVLKKILEGENVKFELATVLEYANRYTDLRRMIMTAQRSVMMNKGELKPASEVQASPKDLLTAVLSNNWDTLVKVATDPAFDARQALKDMFWGVGDVTVPKPAQWRFILAKGVHETTWTPDPAVHFLGTCAELMVS